MTPPVDRDAIAGYFTRSFSAHGDTPRGMDWNGEEAQVLRFTKLLQHLDLTEASLLDLGCGTGELYAKIRRENRPLARYQGIDLVGPMIDTARAKFAGDPRAAFAHGSLDALPPDARFDYVVSSGIFNAKQDVDAADWQAYMHDTVRAMFQHADKAVAFNVLTAFSDPDRRASHLFYADPGELMAFSRRELSRFMLIDHSYKFFEFTAVIRREAA